MTYPFHLIKIPYIQINQYPIVTNIKSFFGMIVNLIRIDTNDDGVTDYKPKVSFGTW